MDTRKPTGDATKSQLSRRDITPELQACFPEQGVIAAYMHWACETTFSDPLFHLAAILPCLAYEVNQRGYRLSHGGRFRMVNAIIAGSGTAKSTAISRARDFFSDWLQAYYATSAPRSPFIHASGSIQGIVHSFQEHWNERAQATMPILYLDELGQLLRLQDTSDALNQLWDGRDYFRHLRQLQREARSGVIRAPVLLGIFASTEDGLSAALQSDQFSGGLFSRFLWFAGEGKPPRESFHLRWDIRAELRAQTAQVWTSWASTLDGWRMQNRLPTLIDTSQTGLKLLEEILLDEVYDHIRTKVGGVMMRLLEYSETIGALYALSQWRHEVTEDDVTRAANLLRHCQQAIFQLSESLSTFAQTRQAARTEQVLRAAGYEGLTKTELYKRTGLPKKFLDEALTELADKGAANQLLLQPATGRPGARWFHRDYLPQPAEPDDKPAIH